MLLETLPSFILLTNSCHLLAGLYINFPASRVHAIHLLATKNINICPKNFVLTSNHATQVADRLLPVALMVGLIHCIRDDVIACVVAARALNCLTNLKFTVCMKTSVCTFYLFVVGIGLKVKYLKSNYRC